MKKIASITLILFFSAANLYAEKIIGITAFENLSKQPNFTWMEIGIPESISMKLRNIKEYIVIDRINVDKIVKEIQLGQSGLLDEKNVKQAGKALNADILVMGSYQIFGNKIRIIAKMVEVESHRVVNSVQATGELDSIFDIQDEIALKIIGESKIEMSQEVKERVTEKYTKNLTAYEYLSKGQKLYYQTQYEEAIKMFNKAVEIDKNYSIAYAQLGKAYANLYWQIKNYTNEIRPAYLEQSFKYTTKALQITPNLDEAHLSLAKYYQNVEDSVVSDKWVKCEEETKKVLELNPNNGEALFLMSRIYGYNDTKEEDYLHKAISKNNFIADAHNNLGIIYLDSKKYDQAVEAFQKAIEIDPEYKLAYMNTGVVYARQGKHREAIEMYKKIVEKYPKYTLALSNIGIGYRDLGDFDTALEWFKKSVEAKPDYGFGWGEIANVYRKKGKYDEAIKYYEISLKHDPKNKYSLSNMGWIYEQKNDFDTAIKYLEKAVEYNPGYAWPAGELGYIYRFKKQNIPLAKKWFDDALKKEPSNDYYQRNVKELNETP